MLSTNLERQNGNPLKRTSRKIISREALALKELRLRCGLTMKAAGLAIGRSDSYVSHLENGRLDFPTGELLERILNIYGGMKLKSFYERSRKIEVRQRIIDQIVRNLEVASIDDLQALLDLCKPANQSGRSKYLGSSN